MQCPVAIFAQACFNVVPTLPQAGCGSALVLVMADPWADAFGSVEVDATLAAAAASTATSSTAASTLPTGSAFADIGPIAVAQAVHIPPLPKVGAGSDAPLGAEQIWTRMGDIGPIGEATAVRIPPAPKFGEAWKRRERLKRQSEAQGLTPHALDHQYNQQKKDKKRSRAIWDMAIADGAEYPAEFKVGSPAYHWPKGKGKKGKTGSGSASSAGPSSG